MNYLFVMLPLFLPRAFFWHWCIGYWRSEVNLFFHAKSSGFCAVCVHTLGVGRVSGSALALLLFFLKVGFPTLTPPTRLSRQQAPDSLIYTPYSAMVIPGFYNFCLLFCFGEFHVWYRISSFPPPFSPSASHCVPCRVFSSSCLFFFILLTCVHL